MWTSRTKFHQLLVHVDTMTAAATGAQAVKCLPRTSLSLSSLPHALSLRVDQPNSLVSGGGAPLSLDFPLNYRVSCTPCVSRLIQSSLGRIGPRSLVSPCRRRLSRIRDTCAAPDPSNDRIVLRGLLLPNYPSRSPRVLTLIFLPHYFDLVRVLRGADTSNSLRGFPLVPLASVRGR